MQALGVKRLFHCLVSTLAAAWVSVALLDGCGERAFSQRMSSVVDGRTGIAAIVMRSGGSSVGSGPSHSPSYQLVLASGSAGAGARNVLTVRRGSEPRVEWLVVDPTPSTSGEFWRDRSVLLVRYEGLDDLRCPSTLVTVRKSNGTEVRVHIFLSAQSVK